MSKEALVFDLGLVEYEKVYTLQRALAKLVSEGNFAECLLLLEHLPVYTVGKSGLTSQELEQIRVLKVDRGGDITYHGPGQLIGYPILYLKNKRVSHYVRTLEESLIVLLRTYKINGFIREGFPGIWIGEEKIASIGVRVKDDVCYHGFALNVAVDLSAFQLVKPCGMDISMTSMEKILAKTVCMQQVKNNYRYAFESCFDVKLKKGDLTLLDSPY